MGTLNILFLIFSYSVCLVHIVLIKTLNSEEKKKNRIIIFDSYTKSVFCN